MNRPDSGPPEVSVVVPVFDEEASLPRLDREIRDSLAGLGVRGEIIYVDDGSRDRSHSVLLEILAERRSHPVDTLVVRLRRNFGQTAALAAGFDRARGEVIVPMDADGQNDPADIGRLLEKLDEGYDVVSGWRRLRRDNRVTRILPSRLANRLLGLTTGLPLHDYGCTLKAYRASLLKDVRLYGDMHRFIPAYLSRVGARVAEIEVNHRPRTAGVSKYGPKRVVAVALDLVLLRFMTRFYSRPMHFFGHAALFFLAATLLVLFLMLVFKFGWLRLIGISYRASFIQTPLPALAASFLLGMLASLFFGILGEILIRVHHESQGLKPYAVLDSRSSRDPA